MPNRIIKESVCTSDTIDRMTWFEECFFHRLWTACDDYGRMDARPAILKSKLFPLKERLSLKDIQNALQKMVDIGCVRLYECDSKPYLYLPSWEVHQQVRAKKSKYPSPDEACNHMISDDCKCPRNPIQSESESNPPTAPQGEADRLFDRFWETYPKKKGKESARKAWLKLSPDQDLFRQIMQALQWQSQSHDWMKDKGQFIPYPATWLNGRRWEDAPDESEEDEFGQIL